MKRWRDRGQVESFPQKALRIEPMNERAALTLLNMLQPGAQDWDDLEDEIERINMRRVELVYRHAHPAVIDRCSDELRVLLRVRGARMA